MRAQEIIAYARSLKQWCGTNNPYTIAERLGIAVLHRNCSVKGFTAQTVKMEGYPAIISINDRYTEYSKKVLCAHELGHAVFHENCVNHFSGSNQNTVTDAEWEANLFAVALLVADDIDERLKLPLEKMNNYLLKSILDNNLEVIERK